MTWRRLGKRHVKYLQIAQHVGSPNQVKYTHNVGQVLVTEAAPLEKGRVGTVWNAFTPVPYSFRRSQQCLLALGEEVKVM